jgi:hypothetical protein
LSDQAEITSSKEQLNKLSTALIALSRSDPLSSLSNEIELRFQWVHTQLAAMEKATDLQHQDMVRVPTLLQTASANLKEILEGELHTQFEKLNGQIDKIYAEVSQKFTSVDNQFQERDTRTDQRAGDTKLAVDAAFAAAKEATAKIEAGFKEQIKALTDLVDTKTAQLAQTIGDLKDRVISIESRASGINSSWLVFVALAGLFMMGITAYVAHSTTAVTPSISYVPVQPTVRP